MRSAWPASEPSPKKSPSLNIPMVASLPLFGDDGESHLACLDIEDGIGVIPLREDASVSSGRAQIFLPAPMVARKVLGSNSFFFLGTETGVMVGCPLRVAPGRLLKHSLTTRASQSPTPLDHFSVAQTVRVNSYQVLVQRRP